MTNKQAPFITFEGGEGSGKTTQIKLIGEWLQSKGIAVHTTREPGGTDIPESKALRSWVVEGEEDRWTPQTETMLYMSDRSIHIDKVIKPKIAEGTWVVSDRFVDSTYAYQSYARGLPLEGIQAVYNFFADGFKPDFTLLLDIDPKVGLKRAAEGKGRNLDEMRFEGLGLAFHQKIREGYLDIAKKNSDRYAVISIGDKTPEEVQNVIRPIIAKRFDI